MMILWGHGLVWYFFHYLPSELNHWRAVFSFKTKLSMPLLHLKAFVWPSRESNFETLWLHLRISPGITHCSFCSRLSLHSWTLKACWRHNSSSLLRLVLPSSALWAADKSLHAHWNTTGWWRTDKLPSYTSTPSRPLYSHLSHSAML